MSSKVLPKLRSASVRAKDSEFAKLLRKPSSLYEQLTKGVVADLRAIPKLAEDDKLGKVLSQSERKAYLDSLIVNMGFSQPVAEAFDKSAFGLPLMGAAMYTHMFAGLGNYIAKKSGLPVEKSMHVHNYYRSPVISEELYRMGYSQADVDDIVAKQFFMQYWSGDLANPDKHMFNPMVRAFYPTTSHMGSGGTDLGRETEMAAAMSYCSANEGFNSPLRIINTGDTGPFTDGTIHALQHIIEAQERGYKMPILFLVHSNNSAISARLDYGEHDGDEGEYAVQRIQERFAKWGDLVAPGTTSWAEDPVEGITSIRKAVDNIFETGKPSWCISRFPFRPGGHASDGSPASDDMLLSQFERYKKCLVSQVSLAADPGSSGNEVADYLESRFDAINGAVQHAITGNKILSRKDTQELSRPKRVWANDPGNMVDLDPNYLLNKRQRAFNGLGNDIYATTINKVMDEARASERYVRYVHQENHHKNKTDTRGGVYGELDKVSDENLKNFVGFMPQEAQVVQVGMGYRGVLPKNSKGQDGLVFVKGPHTVFNEHAKDHLKYAAYRYLDCGVRGNHIYIFDAGSLAFKDKGQAANPITGEMEERDLWLARVGEHHNTPDLSSYAHDANTIMALPIDMNMFQRQMGAMVKLHDVGRQVICAVPTASFGLLHPKLSFDQETIDHNDVIRTVFTGRNKPLHGRRLIVISYGSDTKMIAKELAEQDLEAEMLILPFNRTPKALIRYLDKLAVGGHECEVLVVDPNPGAAMLAPIVFQTREALGYPQSMTFTFCTIEKAFVPYGNGNVLLNSTDIRRSLMRRGIIPGGEEVEVMSDINLSSESRAMEVRPTLAVHSSVEERVLFASGGDESAPMMEKVFAPMDGDGVQVNWHVKVGDVVAVDQLLCEIEGDKATVEVTAPQEGVVAEINLPAGKEHDITSDSLLLTLVSRDQPSLASPSVAVKTKAMNMEAVVSTAPVDANEVTFRFLKKVGDHVKEGDIVAEAETDKSTIEMEAPLTGVIQTIHLKEGEAVDVVAGETQVFAVVASAAEPAKAPVAAAATSAPPITPVATPKVSSVETVPLTKHQLAMLGNMTVKSGDGGDTIPFVLQEWVDFNKVSATAKDASVSPVAVMVKAISDAALETGMNRKLNKNRDAFLNFPGVDVGVAVEVEGQLRVAVVRDVHKKSLSEVMENIKVFAAKGAKLSMADQDMSRTCWVVSSMGKLATTGVIPVLPKGCTGIVGVGKTNKHKEMQLSVSICHATLTGLQGAEVVKAYADKLGAV